MEQKVKNQAYF